MFPKRVIHQNEGQKKLMIVISSFLCIFALKAIFITSAEAQTTFDETQKIKTLPRASSLACRKRAIGISNKIETGICTIAGVIFMLLRIFKFQAL